jgi:hypothetical protein
MLVIFHDRLLRQEVFVAPQAALMDESFLLLFCKKEGLAFILSWFSVGGSWNVRIIVALVGR